MLGLTLGPMLEMVLALTVGLTDRLTVGLLTSPDELLLLPGAEPELEAEPELDSESEVSVVLRVELREELVEVRVEL